MLANTSRIGNITSSEGANAIMTEGKGKGSFGKPALTYLEECNFERRLGRSIETESNAKPLTWGKLVEKRVFDLLGLEYRLVSEETLVHPDIEYWSGSPDAIKFNSGKTVVDIKSPITLKSFCQLVAPLYEKKFHMTETDGESVYDGYKAICHVRDNHKDGEKYYWQLVSNSILTASKYAELIVYCPYASELEAIKEMALNMESIDQQKYAWINWAYNDELPYLPDGGFYKNINIIRFEVPIEDKEALKARMESCKDKLITIN